MPIIMIVIMGTMMGFAIWNMGGMMMGHSNHKEHQQEATHQSEKTSAHFVDQHSHPTGTSEIKNVPPAVDSGSKTVPLDGEAEKKTDNPLSGQSMDKATADETNSNPQ